LKFFGHRAPSRLLTTLAWTNSCKFANRSAHDSSFLFAWFAGQTGTSDAMQHLQAGLEARKQHRVEVEITEFRKATESDPALADAFLNLGSAYMEKHDYGAAIAPLKRALELSPELPVAHQLLGYALLSEGYAAEAIPHLQRVGALDALGIAQIETGQLTEAVSSFTAALAQRPGDPDLLYYLGHGQRPSVQGRD